MTLSKILSQIKSGSESHHLTVPENWLQGRTCYGGLSSAMAWKAASILADDLPPLQSAQIAFSGPLSGDIEIRAHILRRGKNTASIRSDIYCGDDIGLACTFIFMNRRESHLDFADIAAPNFPDIPKDEDRRSGPPAFFTQNMEYGDKRLTLGQNIPRLSAWNRIIERDGLDPMADLICNGDALPPSAMGLMSTAGMVSSMNWQFNLLTDNPQTNDGWWYLDSQTHYAGKGSSSQYMTMYNSEGEPMLTGMQSVAIFS
ncbi:hypothetical protein LPB140_06060 [Sphingorhabdus lutea]|uniref:Thioesterase family protein n=1 Tax=Sphingorhabdus lutea TaxID=1913578 RepID=A0A1L3JEU1_9SPHN|nr:thioesterase family protein [Sphingorhabdus lutea]APG63642.1 hypothetical protein LPB140_06060 [Sphingorhabdus lutea]